MCIALLHSIPFYYIYPDSRMCTSGKPSRTGLPESTRSSTLPPTNRLFPIKALPTGHQCHWLGGLEFAVESGSTKKFRRSQRTRAETLLSQLATSSTSTNNNILKLIQRRFVKTIYAEKNCWCKILAGTKSLLLEIPY